MLVFLPQMVQVLPQSSGRYIALKVTGAVTADDQQTLAPFMQDRFSSGQELRILLWIEEFPGWSIRDMWDEMRLYHWPSNRIEKLAIVGESRVEEFIAWMAEIFSSTVVEFFRHEDIDEAWKWLHADEGGEYLSFASFV